MLAPERRADRTFSDQYLGQAPRVKEDHLAREPEKAGIECISHGGSGGDVASASWFGVGWVTWFSWVYESVSVHPHFRASEVGRVLSMSIQAI